MELRANSHCYKVNSIPKHHDICKIYAIIYLFPFQVSPLDQSTNISHVLRAALLSIRLI